MKLAMFYNEMSLNCKVAHFEAMVSGDGIGSAIVVVQWVGCCEKPYDARRNQVTKPTSEQVCSALMQQSSLARGRRVANSKGKQLFRNVKQLLEWSRRWPPR